MRRATLFTPNCTAAAINASSTSSSAATVSLVSVAARGGFQFYKPKQDIKLGKFTFNEEYQNMRAKSGRVPDHDIQQYRKTYFRIDELCRRQERFIQQQGFFYLPGLDFVMYRGCQPLFTAEQLRLHYGRHHRAYVNKLNELIEGTNFYGMNLDEIIRRTFEEPDLKPIFNNAAQHYNHMFFWKSIQPWGVNFPPELKNALEQQYESLDAFKKEMNDKAMAFFGSGWLWLVYNEMTMQFEIVTTQNAGTPLTEQGKHPLLAMDLWEHTWYNDYENNKAGYVANFLKCADWHWAERNWKHARGETYHDMVWN